MCFVWQPPSNSLFVAVTDYTTLLFCFDSTRRSYCRSRQRRKVGGKGNIHWLRHRLQREFGHRLARPYGIMENKDDRKGRSWKKIRLRIRHNTLEKNTKNSNQVGRRLRSNQVRPKCESLTLSPDKDLEYYKERCKIVLYLLCTCVAESLSGELRHRHIRVRRKLHAFWCKRI